MIQNKVIMVLSALLLFSIGIIIGRKSIDNTKTTSNPLFVNGSDKYLSEIRLDLPEEISTVTQDSDSTIDLLTAYLDAKEGVIYLGFSGKQMNKNDNSHLFITEHSQIVPDLHEYQLDLEPDHMKLFDHGRFLGNAKYGTLQLDSLLMKDNQ